MLTAFAAVARPAPPAPEAPIADVPSAHCLLLPAATAHPQLSQQQYIQTQNQNNTSETVVQLTSKRHNAVTSGCRHVGREWSTRPTDSRAGAQRRGRATTTSLASQERCARTGLSDRDRHSARAVSGGAEKSFAALTPPRQARGRT